VNLSTFRRYLDTTLEPGGSLELELAADEAAYLYPIAGSVRVDDDAGNELATLRSEGSPFPQGPAEASVARGPGRLRLTADAGGEARLLRAIFSR
jgi:redox-sensitive bicupin YhaK (pirin superfamily)